MQKSFVLAGKTVKTSRKARAICRAAIKGGRAYLVPQARSVERQLKAAGQ